MPNPVDFTPTAHGSGIVGDEIRDRIGKPQPALAQFQARLFDQLVQGGAQQQGGERIRGEWRQFVPVQ